MKNTDNKANLLIFIATAVIFIVDVLSPVGYAIWLATCSRYGWHPEYSNGKK